MKWMELNELRSVFLSFFEGKGHKLLHSFPLIPKDDNSLLLINSGMAPMKNWFLGKETPPSTRVVTCQKCIRTPDIELVGKTDRHGTFFEMLGNFSFGDYFKQEAIAWAWEFVTDVLEMPKENLYVTVYEEDDEAYEIWSKIEGLDSSHIFKLGKKDNFWEIGSGPCGPCSEIYYDRGEEFGCGKPDCGPGCDCDRFVEFWNLVFSQFDNDGNGNYTPMEYPNIDTGMGLERLACIIQGVNNLFEIDVVRKVLLHVCDIAKITYGESKNLDISARVITDHIRSSVFLISDGVIPSNEGRGYVLRRLIRRAYRNGKKLGISEPFLNQIAETVVNENESAYPELKTNLDYIKQILFDEETKFEKILDKGMNMLANSIDKLDSKIGQKLSAEDAFKLCDTYGFPFELVKDIVFERNVEVDEEGFFALMREQQERARNAAHSENEGWAKTDITLKEPPTTFVGYENVESEAKILHVFNDEEEIDEAIQAQKVNFIFDQTPFYAEGGGQISDHGVLIKDDYVANITDCQKLKSGQYIHKAVVVSGTFKKNDSVKLVVNIERRNAISRNHTAAHILQKVLMETLGSHVHQAGQLVDEERLRFDFNHFEAVSTSDILKIEKRVNEIILSGLNVKIQNMNKEEAINKGAIALFGEKYGNIVRVVNIGDFSIELCGGTHVDNTAKIGLFKITNEASVASGVRRIEAKTGYNLLKIIDSLKHLIASSCRPLKLQNQSSLPQRVEKLTDDLKNANKKVEELKTRFAAGEFYDALMKNAKQINGLRVVSITFNDVEADVLRSIGDNVKADNPDIVAAIATIIEGKGTLMVVCGDKAIEKGMNAGAIVRELAALVGGKGGGRKDLAMAGVKDVFNIDVALVQFLSIVEKYSLKQ